MLNKRKLKKLPAKKRFYAKGKSLIYLLGCLNYYISPAHSHTSPTQPQEKTPKLISEN